MAVTRSLATLLSSSQTERALFKSPHPLLCIKGLSSGLNSALKYLRRRRPAEEELILVGLGIYVCCVFLDLLSVVPLWWLVMCLLVVGCRFSSNGLPSIRHLRILIAAKPHPSHIRCPSFCLDNKQRARWCPSLFSALSIKWCGWEAITIVRNFVNYIRRVSEVMAICLQTSVFLKHSQLANNSKWVGVNKSEEWWIRILERMIVKRNWIVVLTIWERHSFGISKTMLSFYCVLIYLEDGTENYLRSKCKCGKKFT